MKNGNIVVVVVVVVDLTYGSQMIIKYLAK